MGPTSADRASAPRRGVTMSGDHYFSGAPSSDARHSTIRARIWGRDLEFRTASGVFSGERLDKRSEEHTSELQSRGHLVCRLLLADKRMRCPVTPTQQTLP